MGTIYAAIRAGRIGLLTLLAGLCLSFVIAPGAAVAADDPVAAALDLARQQVGAVEARTSTGSPDAAALTGICATSP